MAKRLGQWAVAEGIQSIEQSNETSGRQFEDSTIRNDLRLQGKETLKKLWDEIKQLPPEQRDVIRLSLEDENGNDLWSILVAADVITLPQLAADLGQCDDICSHQNAPQII